MLRLRKGAILHFWRIFPFRGDPTVSSSHLRGLRPVTRVRHTLSAGDPALRYSWGYSLEHYLCCSPRQDTPARGLWFAKDAITFFWRIFPFRGDPTVSSSQLRGRRPGSWVRRTLSAGDPPLRAQHLDEASPPHVATLHAPSSPLPPPTHRSVARNHVSPPVHLEIFAENTVFELETGNFHTILLSCTAFELH